MNVLPVTPQDGLSPDTLSLEPPDLIKDQLHDQLPCSECLSITSSLSLYATAIAIQNNRSNDHEQDNQDIYLCMHLVSTSNKFDPATSGQDLHESIVSVCVLHLCGEKVLLKNFSFLLFVNSQKNHLNIDIKSFSFLQNLRGWLGQLRSYLHLSSFPLQPSSSQNENFTNGDHQK